MYNQISHYNNSTMESEPIQIDEMTWDEVKIALDQSKNKVRAYEDESRKEIVIINAKAQKQITQINAQAQEKINQIKGQAQEKINQIEGHAQKKVNQIRGRVQKKVAQINGQAQLKVTLTKEQARQRVFEVQQRMRDKARLEILKRDNLQRRHEDFKADVKIKRILHPEVEVKKKPSIAPDLSDMNMLLMKLEKRGIHFKDLSSKASNQATERNYDSSQYSFRSGQSQKPQIRSQTPKRG